MRFQWEENSPVQELEMLNLANSKPVKCLLATEAFCSPVRPVNSVPRPFPNKMSPQIYLPPASIFTAACNNTLPLRWSTSYQIFTLHPAGLAERCHVDRWFQTEGDMLFHAPEAAVFIPIAVRSVGGRMRVQWFLTISSLLRRFYQPDSQDGAVLHFRACDLAKA